ncbi:MAG: DNA repair protein RecO [Treponema sp.]|jgi:DNA repair protein RecO (recombination protein O)|nr:DNA repair protein RecO [Treponema sp.]
MSRTLAYSALVLRNRPSGESNSEITLLTAEEGIIKTTVFGGAKSKLRSHSAPYNSGQVWIYRDPSKDYGKLSDFDVHSWRPGLRELYERTMSASAVAETILSTHGGGGDWASALKIATATLNTLETAGEELCSRLLVHFLWRWADFLGIRPHLESCADCANANEPLWFSAREHIALCGKCAEDTADSSFIHINLGCRRWFAAVEQLEPSELHRYSLDNKSFNEAKALTAEVIAGALGKRLVSWDW